MKNMAISVLSFKQHTVVEKYIAPQKTEISTTKFGFCCFIVTSSPVAYSLIEEKNMKILGRKIKEAFY